MSHGPVTIIVQARTSSQRLPSKVLLPLAGEPAILRMLERVARVQGADGLVLATSDDPSDDRLARIAREAGHEVARGPLQDVLARFLSAAAHAPQAIVRLTGDCPLVDPALVDHHICVYRREQPWAEYVTNAVVRTQPDGLDVEVVQHGMLVEAGLRATHAFDREHVTPWIRRRARTLPVTQEEDLSALRWTLDTREDYEWIAAVFDILYAENPHFGSASVYDLLMHQPKWIRVAGRTRLDAAERSEWVERIRRHREGEGLQA